MKKKKNSSALLVVDMINDLDFPEGRQLKRHALPVAKNILKLAKKFRKKNLPVIYVNDNHGHWRSSWHDVFERCTDVNCLGSEISLLMRPQRGDYIVLKSKLSGFYSTNLAVLLDELGVSKVVITGMAGNICVLYTVNDAHMQGYDIHVPSDCIASNTKKDNAYALEQLKKVFKIPTSPLRSVP